MDADSVKKIIGLLSSMKSRPYMFISADDDVSAVENFFHGYNAALRTLITDEYASGPEFYREVTESRGWELRASSVAAEMREKGYSNKEIVAEIIEIQLGCWERFFNLNEN